MHLFLFVYGIFLAQLALWYIDFLSKTFAHILPTMIIVPSSIFLVAFIITVTMRIREQWASFIPAVYIGTVFRFSFIDLMSSNPKLTGLLTDLVVPILFGLFIGWCTVSLLQWLDKVGLSRWHVRWEIE